MTETYGFLHASQNASILNQVDSPQHLFKFASRIFNIIKRQSIFQDHVTLTFQTIWPNLHQLNFSAEDTLTFVNRIVDKETGFYKNLN